MTEQQLQKRREYHKRWYLENRDRVCQKSAAWAKANPEKKRASCKKSHEKHKDKLRIKRKERVLRKGVRKVWNWTRYRITDEQFQGLIEGQRNKCAICKKDFGDTRITGPHIDHCHDTGVVRGLLCHSCNIAEGAMKNPQNARRLYEYILKHELFYQGRN